jgi:hypothetical protein
MKKQSTVCFSCIRKQSTLCLLFEQTEYTAFSRKKKQSILLGFFWQGAGLNQV